MIDAVVFDLGGVLIDWDPRHLYRQLFADEAEMEVFLATVCTPAWHEQHDLGVDLAASCAALASRHPEHAALITAWADRSEEMVLGAIDGTVALLAELKATGMRCYALSNMERETFPLRRARFGFIDWFDGLVISAHEGVMKPDPRIFRILAERYGLDPAGTLFVDDRDDNVEAARQLGFAAVRFESPEALREVLAAAQLVAPAS